MKRKKYTPGRHAKQMLAVTLASTLCVPAGVPLTTVTAFGQVAEDADQNEATDFEEMRQKWQTLLTGGENLSSTGKLGEDYIESINEAAQEQWDAMNKLGDAEEDTRTCLFEDLPMTDRSTNTGSSQITLTFDRLKFIVQAYATEGTNFYHQEEVKKEIIAAFDMMVKDHYSLYYACVGEGTQIGKGNNSFGNWHDWRIGCPRQLSDMLFMMYEELTPEQIDRYTAPALANNKVVDTTGANRTWIAGVVIQTGILRGDAELVQKGKEGLKDIFKYVAQYDGFHEDGSFIQHYYYSYTGGYGKALLCTMAPIMYVLNGTDFAIEYDDHCEQIFYDLIFEAYEPLIYGGRFMDLAREREVSRVANQDNIPGRQAIRSIIMLMDVLSGDQKERGLSMVKEWLSDDEVLAQVCVDPLGGYNEYDLPAGVIPMALDILNSDVEPRGSLVRHKRYGAMDRIVHLRDNFGFTVSMSSNRIFNTEGTNNEGLRFWHIGDGLTYLYNAAKNYYNDHYWATVDYQRLPGTTVNRVENRAKKAGYGTANPYKFAGGTDLAGEYGVAGMELQGVGTSSRDGAHSRKSWFMFDDEVVAVGSAVRSTLDNSSVETIVENRKIALDKSNVLTVDGVVQNSEEGEPPYEVPNKSLKVTTVTAAGGKNVDVRLPFAVQENGSKKAVISCKIKMPTVEDFFALKMYGTSNGKEKDLVFLTMRDGSMVPRMSNKKDAYSSDAALKADKWHDVKVEIDLENQTFNYYFDGKHITKGVSTGTGYTVDAELVNAKFFEEFKSTEIGADGISLTGFEIAAPGSKAGTIQVDDLSVEVDGVSLADDNFEEANTGVPVGWTIKNNDKGEGSGAEVILEKTQVVPEGRDDFNGVHENTQWIHLAGETEESDVGYYFPGGADITGVRETRKGSWNLVNEYTKFTDNEPRMNSFVTFWFDHGEKPTDDKYAYVVLPGKNADETKEYTENPDVEILCQTDNIHAVRENKLNITGINFFEPGKYQSFRVERPMSVMMQKQEDNVAEISFADPTQTLAKMQLEVSLPIEEVLEMDEGVSAENVDGVTVFTATTTKSARALAGKSFHVKVRLSEYDNTFESDEVGTLPEHWSVENGTGAVEEEENENHVLGVKADGAGFAKAKTVVDCQEEEGNMIHFQLKPVSGKGSVWLGDEESQIQVVSYGDEDDELLTAGEWHSVKIKVNAEKKTIQVMVDGKAYGETKTFENVPTDFVITTDGEIQLDNLLVRPISVQAPDTPKRLTFTSYSDSYVDLQWGAVEGESPIHYTVMVNGEVLEDAIEDNKYRVSGLEPGETYTFQVRCEDDEDNVSEWSDELEVTLLETLNDHYVINFDDYELGTGSQNRWTYAGEDAKGKIEIVEAPEGNDHTVPENMLTDIQYWKRSTTDAGTASPSNATKAQKATASNAEKETTTSTVKAATKKATASNAEKKTTTKVTTATASNAEREAATATSSDATRDPEKNRALYVYSGTGGYDKTVSYPMDKQTRKQVYELDVNFASCATYTNFALVGSNGKQAVTVMIFDSGLVGYRAGDAPGDTVPLLPDKPENEWIHFVIEADPETQTFSIEANGVRKENLKFRYETDDISKLTVNAPKATVGGIYVDNIVLPGDEEYGKWIITALNDEFEEMEVPFGTPFDDLDLPEYVSVAVTDPDDVESDIEVRVNWDADDYDAEQSGKYTIHGTLALPSNYISKISDKELKIKVNVEKKIPVYTLSLVQNAGGTIYSDVEEAEKGTFVTVTAEPDDGYKLAAWIINGERKIASGNDYTFELNEDMEIGAEFEAEPVAPEHKYYKVQLPDQTTGGKIEASSSYAKEGTAIILTVTPDEGYKLSILKVNGKKVEPDEDGQYTFVLSRNTTVSVAFEKISDNSDNGTDNGNSGSHGSGSSSGKSSRVYNSTAPEAKYAVAGTWKQDGDNWSFTKTTGEMVKEQWACILWNNAYNWYYFDQNGMMKTGWIEINGQTFYLQPQSNGHRGEMLTGWQQIDGKWYWFQTESNGNKGALLKNGVTPDGYKVGADGSWERN